MVQLAEYKSEKLILTVGAIFRKRCVVVSVRKILKLSFKLNWLNPSSWWLSMLRTSKLMFEGVWHCVEYVCYV